MSAEIKIIIWVGLLPGKRANDCVRKNGESAKTLLRRRILPLPARPQSDTVFVEEPDSRATARNFELAGFSKVFRILR